MKRKSKVKKAIVCMLSLPINALAFLLSVLLVIKIRADKKAIVMDLKLENHEKGNIKQ